MIKAEGRWQRDIFGELCWDINCSSILTQLIQDAGRWCEQYASDLFISWNCDIEKHLKDRDWEGGTFRYGFREMGVDHDEWVKINEKNHYYYRKIRTLKITIEDDEITMDLN